MKDNSIGIFNGKILVAKEASGTDSILNNNNLLLSDKSEIQSNPHLEINCEDVKCAHGSTSGNLDKEALFYLRSRGIDEVDANEILINGFISKLLSQFNSSDLQLEEKCEKLINYLEYGFSYDKSSINDLQLNEKIEKIINYLKYSCSYIE